MILDGLRYRPHPQHFDIATSVDILNQIGAGFSLLTHMCHDVDHATLAGELPRHIQPAYDGLRIKLPLSSADSKDVTKTVEPPVYACLSGRQWRTHTDRQPN